MRRRLGDAKSKVVIIPSLWEEAFGRVAVEAQAAGCPVIASKRGGLAEAMGPAGVLVEKFDDVGAWREGLEIIVADQELCDRLAQMGRQRCKTFSSEKAAEKIVDIFRAIRN